MRLQACKPELALVDIGSQREKRTAGLDPSWIIEALCFTSDGSRLVLATGGPGALLHMFDAETVRQHRCHVWMTLLLPTMLPSLESMHANLCELSSPAVSLDSLRQLIASTFHSFG
jgi:hypothetical protein